jgi:hypothetical protein
MTALKFHDVVVVVVVVVVQSTKAARQKPKGHELLKQTTTSHSRTTRSFMQDLKLAINAIDCICFDRTLLFIAEAPSFHPVCYLSELPALD